MRDIHIWWDGPFDLTQLTELREEKRDYGLYQVYGSHPLYGSDVLLYIGMAEEQTLGKRLLQEGWHESEDWKTLKFYVGRLFGETQLSNKEWGRQIRLAESLLIYAHAPAYNGRGVASLRARDGEEWRVSNWGAYRMLQPEVSSTRWSSPVLCEPTEKYFTWREGSTEGLTTVDE